MNEEEGACILESQLRPYRSLGYVRLLRLLEDQDTCEVIGASGRIYQVEIQAVWDGPQGGDLRVMGSIDNGGWRAFVPLTSDFIVRPDLIDASPTSRPDDQVKLTGRRRSPIGAG